jgi:hypothetical protein
MSCAFIQVLVLVQVTSPDRFRNPIHTALFPVIPELVPFSVIKCGNKFWNNFTVKVNILYLLL